MESGLTTEKENNMDIIIHAKPEVVEHKMLPDVCECWWDVAGTPRQLFPYDKVMFSYKGRVHAEGYVIDIEPGRILMDPLKKVDYPAPTEPPTRGFKYVRENGDGK